MQLSSFDGKKSRTLIGDFRQSNRRRKMDTDFFFSPASAAAAFFRPIGA